VIGSLQIHRILYLLQTQAALLPQGLAAQKSSPATMAVFIAACLCLPLVFHPLVSVSSFTSVCFYSGPSSWASILSRKREACLISQFKHYAGDILESVYM
jgi:hypothetical protein